VLFSSPSRSIATPPPAGQLRIGSAFAPSNRIVPPSLQLPSAPVGASQTVCGGPPVTATFFSLPPATKPSQRLSGDQNGRRVPSVPGSGAPRRVERAENHPLPPFSSTAEAR
jgi:hypothetical protein